MSRPGQIRFLSRAAPLYDPVVRMMGFPRLWRALTHHAGAGPEVRCLDVCTGTGGTALAVADAGAPVVGIDLASGMLREAERKARESSLGGRVRLVRMDARRLAFRDASFPLVTCTMALHEMSERERDTVLGEVRRVASERVLVADYRVPRTPGRSLLFRAVHAFEYLESDDFAGFAAREMSERLEAADLRVETPFDAGAYRIWPCRVSS